MGSGKSWLGQQLTQHLPFNFIDLDDYIEQKRQLSIPEIFEQYGEEKFRQIESICLKSLKNKTNCIIALGGGTPCFFDNMDWILENGIAIYLDVVPSILVNRLMKEQEKRPLLKNYNSQKLLSFIERKIAERQAYYKKANIHYLIKTGKEPILKELVAFTKAEFRIKY